MRSANLTPPWWVSEPSAEPRALRPFGARSARYHLGSFHSSRSCTAMADFFEAPEGGNLSVLSGQDNYSKWARDFKVVAVSKGVYDLYLGKMKILAKPEKDTYLNPSGGATSTRKKT